MSFENLGGSSIKINVATYTYAPISNSVAEYLKKANNSTISQEYEKTNYEESNFFDDVKEDFNTVMDFLQKGNKSKSKTSLWSSWYGGSAKHTKDHLHTYVFEQIFKTEKGICKTERTEGSGFFNNIVNKISADNKFAKKMKNSKIYKTNKSFQNSKDGQDVVVKLFNKKIGTGTYDSKYRVGQNWQYGSVKLLEYGTSIEGSAHNFFNVGGKDDFYKARADLLYASADCSASLTPNGLILSAGAEASVLHADGKISGDWTNEKFLGGNVTILGGSASASADVGHVYADAKLAAGRYIDDDGNPHIEVGLQGKIGADACSATVSADGTFAGIGVGGSFTAKVGIGAQFNVGFIDGKLTCHVGAALGIGVEVGFSLDVSDWTGYVTEGIQEFGNTAVDMVSDIWTGAKEVGKCICDWFT